MPPKTRPPLPLPAPPPLVAPPELAARLAELGAPVDARALTALGDYLARLLAMNEQMNLTAIVEPAAAWERHVLDALTLAPLIPAGARVVDVGSGGGVPGIPLAIARPDLAVTLVEATQRKAAFLSAVSRALGLARVEVRAQRAEQLRDRGAFQVATARAVARIVELAPLLSPLVAPGGQVLLIKGQRADEELAEAASALEAAALVHTRTVTTPTGRVVVLARR